MAGDKIEYPKYVYHRDGRTVLVNNLDEHDALGDEFSEEKPEVVEEPAATEEAGAEGVSDGYFEAGARATHEANRILCLMNGDRSQKPWAESTGWQKDSAIAGVKAVWDNPSITPEEQHHKWAEIKLADGWTYGPEKDVEKKTHPCLVPYAELPYAQRVKDFMFGAVARGFFGLPQLAIEDDMEQIQHDAEIDRMLKDYPAYESQINQARVSGSPLHLVAAKIAESEAQKQPGYPHAENAAQAQRSSDDPGPQQEAMSSAAIGADKEEPAGQAELILDEQTGADVPSMYSPEQESKGRGKRRGGE